MSILSNDGKRQQFFIVYPDCGHKTFVRAFLEDTDDLDQLSEMASCWVQDNLLMTGEISWQEGYQVAPSWCTHYKFKKDENGNPFEVFISADSGEAKLWLANLVEDLRDLNDDPTLTASRLLCA